MPSTQQFLPVKEIKEGIIILKNGQWRSILMASSINFGLLSKEEQEAIIYQYQNFLNSLDFTIQILVQSRKLNITGYLKKLKEMEEKQDLELLRIQAIEYREFIKSLTEMTNLMTKNFYVIIPFYPPSSKEFSRWKNQFEQRKEYVMAGLRRVGINSVPLGNEEIIELLWSFYNPTAAEKGEIPPFPEI